MSLAKGQLMGRRSGGMPTPTTLTLNQCSEESLSGVSLIWRSVTAPFSRGAGPPSPEIRSDSLIDFYLYLFSLYFYLIMIAFTG